jgi:hypothetical protein
MITQDKLKEVMEYSAADGVFRWKISKGPNARKGQIVGKKKGYPKVTIDGAEYKLHRLAWLYVYGNFPVKDLDHINGITYDFAISNLRECNDFENQQNRSVSKRNKCGYPGVSFSKRINKWSAQIMLNRQSYFLGNFDDAKDAGDAYKKAKQELHTFNPTIR